MSDQPSRISEPPMLIQRHSAPNIYDHAPVGSQCKVVAHDGSFVMYTQTSRDENNPRWEILKQE
jgi:hypothetical protein